jgi:Cu-Zn family superoxide dismutase
MSNKLGLLLLIALLVSACSHMSLRSPAATATLAPTRGNQASGTVNFVQRGDLVQIDARITGLTPGLHGFHIHEKGDCRAPDGASAGGHFNPASAPHAGPDSKPRHAGDLGNIIADANGVALYKGQVAGITLEAGSDSIVGRAVIVHAGADDLRTQPSGNAGARVACGLISKSADKWF